MQVYLSADIEGTCGIADWSETERSTPQDYRPFQAQMTREVCAACQGALAAGAEARNVNNRLKTDSGAPPCRPPPRRRFFRAGRPSRTPGISGQTFTHC